MWYLISAYLIAFLVLAFMLAQSLYVYTKFKRELIDLESESDLKKMAQ
jgi:heme exporter protein CcmD